MKIKKHNNKDLMNKFVIKNMTNRIHKFIGGEGDFDYFIPTEIVTGDNEHHFIADIGYVATDGRLYNIEPQSNKCDEDDLDRFDTYAASFQHIHNMKVVTVVWYNGDPKNIVKEHWVTKTHHIVPITICFKLMDGQEALNRIKTKVRNNIELEYTEPIELIYIPIMDLKNWDVEKVIEEICYLIRDDETMSAALKNIVSRSFRFMIYEYIKDNETVEKLIEVLNMPISNEYGYDFEDEETIAMLMHQGEINAKAKIMEEIQNEILKEVNIDLPINEYGYDFENEETIAMLMHQCEVKAHMNTAKQMYEDGISEDLIFKYTGLHLKDIK